MARDTWFFFFVGIVVLFKIKNVITVINFCLTQKFSFLILKVSHLLYNIYP